MQEGYETGIVVQPSPGAVPRMKRYLDEQEGRPIDSVWTDIPPINSQAKERLGYPTQKPLKLLERILEISSNPNDIILDAFCGCGTTLVAAQNSRPPMDRHRHLSHRLPRDGQAAARCLQAARGRELLAHGKGFIVRDLPWTEKQLRAIPPFEFENWAVIALGGIPNKTQVGDMGIDGRIYPVGSEPAAAGKEAGELDFMDDWYPIQVKQMDKVGRPDIDNFEAAMIRTKRKKGFFVGFDFSSDAITEINRFFRSEHIVIVPLTVREILDETIAYRLA